MPAPVVVVQGLPPAPDLRNAALSACSEALKFRSCVSPDDSDRNGSAPIAKADVSWPDGEGRHARVIVERVGATENRRVDRDTRFSDRDPIVERWRTIGLVIAALVGESETTKESSDLEERPSPPAFVPRPEPRGWLGLSGFVGPGLDDGSVRLGLAIQGAIALSSMFFLQGSASHAIRPEGERGIDVRWTTLTAGGGLRTEIPNADIALRARFELLVEYLRASSSSGLAVSGGGSKISPGIRYGGEARWPARSAVGMTLGFSAWSLPGGTAIQINGQK
ncbi:MAG: hypothetical protein ABW133_05560, partial [Polyangiaceae bacterium]